MKYYRQLYYISIGNRKKNCEQIDKEMKQDDNVLKTISELFYKQFR